MIDMDIYRIVKMMNKNPWGITVQINDNELYFPLARAKGVTGNIIHLYLQDNYITCIPVNDIMAISPGHVLLGKEK